MAKFERANQAIFVEKDFLRVLESDLRTLEDFRPMLGPNIGISFAHMELHLAAPIKLNSLKS